MSSLVQSIAVQPSPPSLADNTGDLDRLRKAVRAELNGADLSVPFSRLHKLARRFRQAGFVGSAVVNNLPRGPELVDFLPAREPGRLLPAMAVDLGTTQLAATLLDLESGRELASAGLVNSQICHGADILSRIHFAGRGDGLAVLQSAVVADINNLAASLAAAAGCAVGDIRAISIAGNPTMVHFLLALDPWNLCREPYIPVANAPDVCAAADLGLHLHPAAPVWVLPSVGSYFGGDLIAGIVASGMAEAEEASMLIDVGTNAEVVIGNREWLVACAGAAGPALEGGVARMGMRAAPGAVERVSIDPVSGRISYKTIGDQPPRGLCGSGMIDLAASLYLARIIDIRGKLKPVGTHPGLVQQANGLAFVLASAAESATGEPVMLEQVDLDAMMRSKAAMYSILTTLTGQVGMNFGDFSKIYVAGAFGQHIDPRSAIVLGMLPDLPLETFVSIGNSSLAGCRLVLLSEAARRQSRALPSRITYMELNVNHEFMNRFSGCRFIPHTDNRLFPSVPFFND